MQKLVDKPSVFVSHIGGKKVADLMKKIAQVEKIADNLCENDNNVNCSVMLGME